MFCEKCGTKNEDGAIFCENCGNKLIVEEFAKKEKFTAPNLNSEGGENRAVTIEKKPMSLKTKIILIVVFVLAVALIGTYNVCKYLADPKLVVEKYVESIISKDYASIYDSMDFEPNEFTKKEAFVKLMKDSEDNLKISNYTLSEELSEDPLVKTYKISYFEKGMNESRELFVDLIVQQDKKYLLFDDYKISADGFAVNNYSVTVPKDGVVYINDIEVPEKYLSNEDTSSDKMKTYKIPSIFAGTYQVKVQVPNCEEKILEDYYIGKDNEINVTNFYLTPETVSNINTIAKDFMNAFFSAFSTDNVQEVLPYLTESEKTEFTTFFNENYRSGFTYKIIEMDCHITSQDVSFPECSLFVETDGFLDSTFFIDDYEAGELLFPKINFHVKYENGNWLVCDIDINRGY